MVDYDSSKRIRSASYTNRHIHMARDHVGKEREEKQKRREESSRTTTRIYPHAAVLLQLHLLRHPIRRQNIHMVHTRTGPRRGNLDKDIFAFPHFFALGIDLLVGVEEREVPAIDAAVEAVGLEFRVAHEMVCRVEADGVDLLAEFEGKPQEGKAR